MKDLTKVFIDLSKCSEEQQVRIFSLLPERKKTVQYWVDKHNSLLYFDNEDGLWWVNGDIAPADKTELTYPDFIKLFEGGEGGNDGWIKIESEADLPKEELDVHFIFTDEKVKYQTFGVWDNRLKSFYSGALKIDNVIYYQPLIKPNPPKF